MKIEQVKIKDLKPADYNPRRLTDKQHEDIKASLEGFGFVDPVIVNKDNTIIGGHQRVKVWKAMGNKEVPVFYVDLTKDKEKELNVRLNKNSGEWDWTILNTSFEMPDLLKWGFNKDEFDIKFEPEETVGDDDVPEKAPAITVKGDLYELGEHRVLCGDSTLIDDVEKLMDGQKADMYLSDPPYNVAYEGKTKDKLTIQNDAMSDEDFRTFLRDAFQNIDLALKEGGVFYIWHADSEGYNFRGACFDIGWKVRQCLIWNKNSMVMGRQDYHWKHEPCLYGWKEGAAHTWVTDRKQTTILEFNRPTRSKEHPTMKPLDLLVYQIGNNTIIKDLVIDNFLGSGSTLIASEKTNRKCYGMELDEHYCDVIVKRYVDFCKKNNRPYSVKRNGEECNTFDIV